ncbi:hypothetical protein NC651_011490 [Populus alba x Populus x berolinensis]|nr:hypothetical protein NC651_011490 [Populus alba x Populus x berolinensis]
MINVNRSLTHVPLLETSSTVSTLYRWDLGWPCACPKRQLVPFLSSQ